MSYVTQERNSVIPGGSIIGDPWDPLSYVSPVIEHVGNLTQKYSGVVASVTPLFTYPGNIPYGSLGGIVGTQQTYSWRTGTKSPGHHERVREGDLTGEEMRAVILAGGDIDVSSPRVGTDRIIDRTGSGLFRTSDYNSGDNGHEFRTTKFVNNHNVSLLAGVRWPVSITLREGISEFTLDWWGYPPSAPGIPFDVPASLSLAERNYVGNRLYKSAVPTRPYSQTVRAIGETIKDGLPAMTGVPFVQGHGAAGEYLNFQFGVAPTVSDLKKFAEAVKQSHKIVEHYHRNSGKYLRREREMREAQASEVKTLPLSGMYWTAAHGSPTGAMYDLNIFLARFYTSEQRTGVSTFSRVHSFAGAFTYALPDADDVLSRFEAYASKANHLYGLQFSPDVAYDLSPFSWLADWFVDFGTVLDNAVANSTDSLVSKYAYNMLHDVHSVSTTVTGMKDRNGANLPAFVASDTTLTRKYRDRASPFGFGVDIGGLTSFQWSILAALGLSRGSAINLSEPR